MEDEELEKEEHLILDAWASAGVEQTISGTEVTKQAQYRVTLKRYIRKNGYQVAHKTSGAELRKMCKTIAKRLSIPTPELDYSKFEGWEPHRTNQS